MLTLIYISWDTVFGLGLTWKRVHGNFRFDFTIPAQIMSFEHLEADFK